MKCSIVRFPNRLEHHTSEYCCILPHALFFSPYTISLLIMRCHIHKITRIHGIREVNAKENTFNHKFVGYLKHFSRTLPISIGYTRRVYVILATGFFLIMYWENGKPDLNFLEYITHTQIQRNERTICSIYTFSVWWGTRTESHFISFALATATRVQFTVYIHLWNTRLLLFSSTWAHQYTNERHRKIQYIYFDWNLHKARLFIEVEKWYRNQNRVLGSHSLTHFRLFGMLKA